ncbi:hypothetical protein BRLA_c037860 [Brevibacillus laterosporus LMG 15441]|uniref:Uncharacterized protein n=1 Tax=Brevibacillus laterosporus LMG 15441 TaxID=1042163 RepID=A0A075R9M0_BRELA|nr:hypothetical protein BRLA_c037860 [Brevibacillus laterosporus LMG 15441]ERM16421.1 hypothetical protein P615_04145 [Brevibacillus laterosporus PE36]
MKKVVKVELSDNKNVKQMKELMWRVVVDVCL